MRSNRAGLAGFLLGLAAVVASAAPAVAQGTGTSGSRGDGTSPAPGQSTPLVPGNGAAGSSAGAGVIHPPAAVDPGITRPAPPAEKFAMPVVPPPGTAGGKPDVVAK